MRQKKAKNKKEKPAHTTQNGQTGNGCKSLRKSGNQTRRPGNDAAECGQRKAAEGRHDCGKPHAQPPGGGTSLHPGAASQTGQTAAAKAPHTQAHGGRTAGSGSAGQTKPDTKAAGCPQAGTKAAAHGQKKRRGTRHESSHNSGRPRKNDQPGRRRGAPNAEKPLRTGKIRVRSFACPEGPCEPGPPKNRFAVFGWHGLFLLRAFICCALRRTRRCTKGGAAPFYPLQAF